jgi:HEAT repeat protein
MTKHKAGSISAHLTLAVFLVASAIAFAFIVAGFPGEVGKKPVRTGPGTGPKQGTRTAGQPEKPQPESKPERESNPSALPEPAFESTVSLSEREIAGLIEALLQADSWFEKDYARRAGRIAERLVQAGLPAWRAVCSALDGTGDEFARSRLNAVLACMRWRFSPYTVFLLESQTSSRFDQFLGELYTRAAPPKGEWFEKLQKLFDNKDAPALMKSFTDEMNPDASYYIVEFLEKLGEHALKPLLEALLREEHPYAAFCIRISLMRVAPGNLARLREYAADPSEKVRLVAVRALGLSGRKDAVPAIVRALGDESADVRYNAATMLSLIPDRRAVSGLVRALKDKDDEVAYSAARALGIIGDPEATKPLQEYFHSGKESAMESAASALAGIGEQSAQVLMSFLSDPEESVRVEAAAAMSQLRSPSTVPALLKALTDKSLLVRLAAVDALAYTGGRGVPEALRGLLSDADDEMRAEAARALGRLRDEASAEALGAALKDEVVTVRLAAISALGKVGGGRALDILAGSLANPELAPLAAPGIRKYGDSAGPPLLQALAAADPEARSWIIGLLADLHIMAAVPALVERLADPDTNTRFCADKALGIITGHETSYKFDAPEAERAEGAKEWRQWWEKHKEEDRERK